MERSPGEDSPADVERRNRKLFEQGEIEEKKMLELIKSKGILVGGQMTVYRVEYVGSTGQVVGIGKTMRIPSRVFYRGVENRRGVGAVLLTERLPDIEGDERRKKDFVLGSQEINVEAGWDERVPQDL